jgi:hypothetical protein
MPSYTVKQLSDKGPPFAMALLLKSLQEGRPFVTYREIGYELEQQLGIKRIFSTQIGHVAGSLMDQILVINPEAPLINTLVTHADGLPGKGVGGYFATRYGVESYRNWDALDKNTKRDLVMRERDEVFRYDKWRLLNKQLFGPNAINRLMPKEYKEQDGQTPSGTGYGEAAESEEHKKLKKWVSENPNELGLKNTFGNGTTESLLLSGDKVDVLFSCGNEFVTAEVKSIKSSDDDFERGIYQCVKYRSVKEAEQKPYLASVRSLLVTERELSNALKARAKQLGINWICVSVNP